MFLYPNPSVLPYKSVFFVFCVRDDAPKSVLLGIGPLRGVRGVKPPEPLKKKKYLLTKMTKTS